LAEPVPVHDVEEVVQFHCTNLKKQAEHITEKEKQLKTSPKNRLKISLKSRLNTSLKKTG
jgi:hypothetical protein